MKEFEKKINVMTRYLSENIDEEFDNIYLCDGSIEKILKFKGLVFEKGVPKFNRSYLEKDSWFVDIIKIECEETEKNLDKLVSKISKYEKDKDAIKKREERAAAINNIIEKIDNVNVTKDKKYKGFLSFAKKDGGELSHE